MWWPHFLKKFQITDFSAKYIQYMRQLAWFHNAICFVTQENAVEKEQAKFISDLLHDCEGKLFCTPSNYALIQWRKWTIWLPTPVLGIFLYRRVVVVVGGVLLSLNYRTKSVSLRDTSSVAKYWAITCFMGQLATLLNSSSQKAAYLYWGVNL